MKPFAVSSLAALIAIQSASVFAVSNQSLDQLERDLNQKRAETVAMKEATESQRADLEALAHQTRRRAQLKTGVVGVGLAPLAITAGFLAGTAAGIELGGGIFAASGANHIALGALAGTILGATASTAGPIYVFGKLADMNSNEIRAALEGKYTADELNLGTAPMITENLQKAFSELAAARNKVVQEAEEAREDAANSWFFTAWGNAEYAAASVEEMNAKVALYELELKTVDGALNLLHVMRGLATAQ